MTTHILTIDGKRAEYRLEPTKNRKMMRFICAAARIDQIFETEDIPGLLLDLPGLIQEEWQHETTRASTLRFRTTATERLAIEKRAKTAGKSLSDYLREKALA